MDSILITFEFFRMMLNFFVFVGLLRLYREILCKWIRSDAYFLDEPVFLNEDIMIDSHVGFVHIGRGCVFKCTFCINSIHKDPTVRLRSVDRVIAEIKQMLAVCKKIKMLFFMDEISIFI